MSGELSGQLNGISERFAPEEDPGRLIEVEHLSRYRWASQLAGGRTVLDAGCGTGYGTKILALAGATSVTGVDVAGSVLQAVSGEMPENVTLREDDLNSLIDANDTYELIICFEVIEHFEDPFPVLDELVRVLAPNGVLLVSSPNRGVYQEGNPHHLHEFTPDELEAALTGRLGRARLSRQSNFIASAVLADAPFEASAGDAMTGVALEKLIGSRPGEETYTVAVASDAELPEMASLTLLTGTLEMREWLSVFDVQTQAISDKDAHIAQLEQRVSETERIQALLMDAEQRTARLPELELRIAELERALAESHGAADAARAQARELDERLMHSAQIIVDLTTSPSWQATKPLRTAKRLLRDARS